MLSFWCLGLHCTVVLMKLSWVKMPSLEIASPVSECSAVTLMNYELFKKIQYWTFPLGATEFQSWNISQERLNLKLQVFSEVLICGMLNLSSCGMHAALSPKWWMPFTSLWEVLESERPFWGSALPLLFPPRNLAEDSAPMATLPLLCRSSPKPKAVSSVERKSFIHSP